MSVILNADTVISGEKDIIQISRYVSHVSILRWDFRIINNKAFDRPGTRSELGSSAVAECSHHQSERLPNGGIAPTSESGNNSWNSRSVARTQDFRAGASRIHYFVL
jgi:hypothetical protein